jgi:hypothetical protein
MVSAALLPLCSHVQVSTPQGAGVITDKKAWPCREDCQKPVTTVFAQSAAFKRPGCPRQTF